MFASAALLLLAVASPAFGALYMTSPVAATSWTAGQQATISWQDDGQAPTLKDFGNAKVAVYVGSPTQQTLIQEVAPSVDVSTTSSVVFTPDASKGENSNQYFVRIESINLKDATNSAYPALAFSAKFAISGMTGAFTADAKAQIAAGQSNDASGAAAATTGAAGSTSAAASATSNAATSKAATSSHAPSSTASAKAAAGSNAATSLSGSAVGLAGVAVAALSMLF